MANFNDNSVKIIAPSEIGKVLSTTSVEPQSMIKEMMKIILFIVFLLLPIAFIWLCIEMEWKLNYKVIGMVLAFSYYSLYKGRKAFKVSFDYKGVDYFLGENGFSEIEFRHNRNNITGVQTVMFNDVAFLFSSGTNLQLNSTNGITDFYLTFYNKASDDGTYVYSVAYAISDSWVSSKSELFRFWQNVEKQWSKFFVNQQHADEVVYFPVLKDETLYPKNITVGPDYLDISGTRFGRRCVKAIHFNNDKCTIEHVDHKISVMGGFTEEGKMITVNLSELGNRTALFELLKKRNIID